MGVWKAIIAEQVVNKASKVADEGLIGLREVTGKFVGNYVKRRNVGFNVIPSVAGSYHDTRNYYAAVLAGREPKEMVEAVIFDV